MHSEVPGALGEVCQEGAQEREERSDNERVEVSWTVWFSEYQSFEHSGGKEEEEFLSGSQEEYY